MIGDRLFGTVFLDYWSDCVTCIEVLWIYYCQVTADKINHADHRILISQ